VRRRVNAEGSDGVTALMFASGKGQALAVQYMLRHGVEVQNASHDKLHPPLTRATIDGHLSVAALLLEAGVQQLGCSKVNLLERMRAVMVPL
jgi:ankyrin repeat protein